MRYLRHLIMAIMILFLLLAMGMLGYRILEGWSFSDALYMTVITITTVGYAEVHPLSQHGRIFTVILIIASLGGVGYIFGSIAHTFVAGEIREILGRQRMEKRVKRLNDHYILCGYGRIGSHIAAGFAAEGLPFVVVEKDPEGIARLQEARFPYVEGDATNDEVLLSAGVQRAKCLVAATGTDADNLYITISAKALNPSIYILSRAAHKDAENKLLAAGADRVVSPYQMGAIRMLNAVLRPNVVDFIDLVVERTHLELQLEEITVEEGSGLKGKTVKASGINKERGLILVAIKKRSGDMAFNPYPDTTIEEGDCLIVLGEKRSLGILERLAHTRRWQPNRRRQ